eukprot:TRINITY_DN913_c0_g6_i1.p1 TRINITY_DN913_c0_g6~~TRINITY_DN913_c0_g6_i1.p1  ORF type:complete len:190 (+),score=45.57 TRINITY_DN913_c0_g6_i1:73-642(+)
MLTTVRNVLKRGALVNTKRFATAGGPGPSFLFKERYNMDTAPSRSVLLNYNAALVAAAACDGMDAREEAYVIGLGVSQGLSEQDIRVALTQDWTDEKIEATIRAFCSSLQDDSWKGYLIYDAIRACSADLFYSPEEHAKVRKIAAMMGVEDDHVVRIEKLVVLQDQLMAKGVRMMKNLKEPEITWDDGF